MKLFTMKEIKIEQQTHLDEILRKESVVSSALKAHEAKMNALTGEYQKKRAEKEAELRDIEFRIKTTLYAEQQSVESLEERKREALKPIDKEREEVQALIRKNDETVQKIIAEREALESEARTISNKDYELEKKRRAFEESQSAILNLVARQQQDADAAVAMMEAMTPVFEGQRKRSEDAVQKAQFIKESAEKAEMIARAAMIAADERIAKEKEEQKKTDEKRSMLALAIKEIKRRGLWYAVKNKEAYD